MQEILVITCVRPPPACTPISNVTFAISIHVKMNWQLSKLSLFFRLHFNVYIDVDDRERAWARDKKQQRRWILLEEKHENFIAAVKKWEILAATTVKMSGSEKVKANRDTYNISCIKRATRRTIHVVVVQNNGKECALHSQTYYLWIRHWFFSILVAVAV